MLLGDFGHWLIASAVADCRRSRACGGNAPGNQEVRTGREIAVGREKGKANPEPVRRFDGSGHCAATFTSGLLRTQVSHPERTAVAQSARPALERALETIAPAMPGAPDAALRGATGDEYAGARAPRG